MADAINDILCNENANELCEVNSDYILTCKDAAATTVWGSGLVATTQRATNFAQSCHFKQSERFWLPPEWAEAGGLHCEVAVADDDGCDCEGLSMGRENYFKIADIKCWGMNDCEQACLGANAMSPLDAIQNTLVGPYFVSQLVGKLLGSAVAISQSIVAAGAASPYANLIIDECTEPKPVDECTFIDANCMKDCGAWDGVLMHKDLVMKALKRRYIECYCEYDGGPQAFRTTDGMRVIVVPKSWGDVYLKDANGCYISIFFMNGAFEYGEGVLPTPFERYRDPKANKCSGADSVYYRRLYTLRPRGTTFDCEQTGTELYVPNSELIVPDNWTITVPMENFGLGFALNSLV